MAKIQKIVSALVQNVEEMVRSFVCKTCGEDMPCSGTDSDIIDQSWCKSETGKYNI